MPESQRIAASDILRQTAVEQETMLRGKNEFRETSTEYSAGVVPDEIDGSKDVRTKLTVINLFTENQGYKSPDGANV